MMEKPGASLERKDEDEFFRRCDAMMEVYKKLEEQRKTGPRAEGHFNPADYPVPEYSFQMGGTTVSLAGYWHEMGYFDEHKEQIEGHIKGAAVLVTEQARLAEGGLKDKTVEIPDDFFEEVEKVAWRNHVSVVSNDSHMHPRIKRTGMLSNELKDADGQLTQLKAEVFLSALALTTGALGLGVYDKLKSRLEGATMSRRSFLLGGVAAGVAAISATSLYATLLNKNLAQPYNRRAGSPVGPFMFDSEDYRDVATAYTIATMAKSLPAKSRVAVVYGSGHMRSIKHYLDDPTELAIKMAMYRAAYGDAIPESVVYTPTGADISRSSPEKSWIPENQKAFVSRKNAEKV